VHGFTLIAGTTESRKFITELYMFTRQLEVACRLRFSLSFSLHQPACQLRNCSNACQLLVNCLQDLPAGITDTIGAMQQQPWRPPNGLPGTPGGGQGPGRPGQQPTPGNPLNPNPGTPGWNPPGTSDGVLQTGYMLSA
jgi:hypothetical protein